MTSTLGGGGFRISRILRTTSTDKLREMRERGRGSKIPKILRTSSVHGPLFQPEIAELFLSTGIYKMTVDNDKLGLTKEAIATKVLPFLFPLSIENGLSPSQYSVIMALVRQLVNRVEEEHRAKLEQLHSIQDEQK